MFDRFTDRGRKVMSLAKGEAQRLNHEYIGTEHLLLGLVQEGSGVAANVLRKLHIDLEKVRMELEKVVEGGATLVSMGQLPFTPRAKKVLEMALEEASKLGHNYIGTEHLLLGLVKESEGIAARVLQNLGVKLEDVRAEVLDFPGADAGPEESEEREERGHKSLESLFGSLSEQTSKTPAIETFGRDLTARVEKGEAEPCVGREAALDSVVRILLRRENANPVIIGAAGTGKTALTNALAARIVAREVPHRLRGTRLAGIDIAVVMAGSQQRGRYEERWWTIAREASSNDVVLLFEDLPLILERGPRGDERGLSAAEVLRFFLTEEVRCIGMITPDRWVSLQETDEALARRFQPVMLAPATTEETLAMVVASRAKYEKAHSVVYTEEALQLAVELAARHLTDRCLPGSAFDVIDDAGARVAAERADTLAIEELEAKIERLDAQKQESVLSQDFEKAASVRDEADEARSELDKLMSISGESMEAADKVDVELVRLSVAERTGKTLDE